MIERLRGIRSKGFTIFSPQDWSTPAVEWYLIAIWALWVCQAYLDLDPRVVPGGGELLSVIPSHHLWTRFQACGWCALWDGSQGGGFPAFAETLGSPLHPLVILTTWWFGVIDGAKLALVGSIFLGGIAQWWLGRELGVGWLPRMWGACMAIVAGHLAGKIENGNFGLVLAMAMAALTVAPSLWLARTGSYRAMVALAVTSALLAVAGQGYVQVAMVFMLPIYIILIDGSPLGAKPALLRFIGAAVLAMLLASPFLVPLAHFLPNLVKDTDPSFAASQPLPYYLLNLFIDDREFLTSSLLGKLPYPYMYSLFVGWIPVGFAVMCLALARAKDGLALFFLACYAGFAIFLGSLLPFKWLASLVPGMTGMRFAPFVGALAIPAILGLAMFGLDRLLKIEWPQFVIAGRQGNNVRSLNLNLKWIFLLPVLFVALRQGYDFSQLWIYPVRLEDNVFTTVQALKTPDLQWVEPPFGEHQYIEPAVEAGLKLSPGRLSYSWKDRAAPLPFLEANRSGAPPDTTEKGIVDGIPIYVADEGRAYAVVSYPDASPSLCAAHGTGGFIDVDCESKGRGILTVQENMWDGWKADVDGTPAALRPERWLSVELPPGHHAVHFRYQPWDVPLGLILGLCGMTLCLYYIFRKDQPLVLSNPPDAP